MSISFLRIRKRSKSSGPSKTWSLMRRSASGSTVCSVRKPGPRMRLQNHGQAGRLTGPRVRRWDQRFAHHANCPFRKPIITEMAAKSKTKNSRAKAGSSRKKSASPKARKYVYSWGAGRADGDGSMKPLLGGKGANLAEMSRIGLPVPAGFTVTTEVCTYYYDHKRTYPAALQAQIKEGIAKI